MAEVTFVEEKRGLSLVDTQRQWNIAEAADLIVTALDSTYPDDITFAPSRDRTTGTNNFIPKPRIDDSRQRDSLEESWRRWRGGLVEAYQRDVQRERGLTFNQWVLDHAVGREADPYLKLGRQTVARAVKTPSGEYPHVRTQRMRSFLDVGEPLRPFRR